MSTLDRSILAVATMPISGCGQADRRQRIGVVLVNPRQSRGLAFLARHALGRARRALRG
jgi:hypothetical protein